ncbi:MAG: anti-sigma factor [Gammaproteobacteria bacterium]|nr:anti-sigma factor [Gammaproteobacteria bacterium]
MDKLAEQLRRDAQNIEVNVSDELDRRIQASVRAAGIPRPAEQPPAAPRQRAAGFWWASSLTGVAAAAMVIIILNSRSQQDHIVPAVVETSPVTPSMSVPVIDWKTESAMLTSPLKQELEDLQSDIRKAEQKVKDDIGL